MEDRETGQRIEWRQRDRERWREMERDRDREGDERREREKWERGWEETEGRRPSEERDKEGESWAEGDRGADEVWGWGLAPEGLSGRGLWEGPQ